MGEQQLFLLPDEPLQPVIARVVLDSRVPQLSQIFDYRVPENLRDRVRVGQRVKIPLRRAQRNFGWIVELVENSTYQGQLASISDLVSDVVLLDKQVWELAQAVADRSAGSPSDVLRLAIPKRHAAAEKAYFEEKQGCDAGEQVVSGVHAETEIADPPEAGLTAALGSEITTQKEKDLLTENTASGVRNNQTVLPEYGASNLAEQLIAGNKINFVANFGVTQLSTGNWVSRWALQLVHTAALVLAQQRSTIICVPDYRDITELHDALIALQLGEHTVRIDAKQSERKRYTAHLRTLESEPCIIIGNRSAIYAPAYKLAAIIVWDEADPLFNEPHAPYMHTRDAAILRAQLTGCGLLIAGHVNSAVTQRFIDNGFYLSQDGAPRRPRIWHADAAVAEDSFAGRIPGAAVALIQEHAKQGPVLVQVSKPGSVRVAACTMCNMQASCFECRGPLGVKSYRGALQCLWCVAQAMPWRCAQCHGDRVFFTSGGSSYTAEQFAQQFAGTKIIVSDGQTPVLRVGTEPAIVVATPNAEPIAAGGYRAVVLLDVWNMLNIPRLRVAEDCLRWWHNAVAKLAPDGVCLVASGAGPIVDAFITGNVAGYLRRELSARAELLYPPMVRVASAVGDFQALATAREVLANIPETYVIGPHELPGNSWQLIVRFSYRSGAQVAAALRALLIELAVGSTVATRLNPRPKPRVRLRLKFDDSSVFDEVQQEVFAEY
ncbi:hypothetical protein KJY78_02770 [Canibacter sp. lx-45]|uniref:primosomal protein N' family DNA-binding protein n=1 Tax=Canibacter zhuwentaonis TaxID=2837491 RepID=UPI001BDDC79A|nr:hypothetical protein [Canibacter zhuwentaonis]MBT1035278.1 hypothetical protein [Canibacter zhuwentaonis]